MLAPDRGKKQRKQSSRVEMIFLYGKSSSSSGHAVKNRFHRMNLNQKERIPSHLLHCPVSVMHHNQYRFMLFQNMKHNADAKKYLLYLQRAVCVFQFITSCCLFFHFFPYSLVLPYEPLHGLCLAFIPHTQLATDLLRHLIDAILEKTAKNWSHVRGCMPPFVRGYWLKPYYLFQMFASKRCRWLWKSVQDYNSLCVQHTRHSNKWNRVGLCIFAPISH